MKSQINSKAGMPIATISNEGDQASRCAKLSKIREWNKILEDENPYMTFTKHSPESDSAEHVIAWLAPLKPSVRHEVPMAIDLHMFQRAVASIVEATDSQVLTENEAAALINHLTSQFFERRVENIFTGMFTEHAKSKWFMAATRKLHGF